MCSGCLIDRPFVRSFVAFMNDRMPLALRFGRRLRVALGATVLVPPIVVGLLTENVGLIVAVTGSLFGAFIQVGL